MLTQVSDSGVSVLPSRKDVNETAANYHRVLSLLHGFLLGLLDELKQRCRDAITSVSV